MASAAEQMAANLSWGTFGKAKELQNRILFAVSLLIVYRLGTYIPVPGIDAARLQAFIEQAGAGIGGMLNMFTGGAVGRMAIFALGIMPYISASIIVQLLALDGAEPGGAEQGGRAGPQADQPVHPLWHGVPGDVPGLWRWRSGSSPRAWRPIPGWFFRIACVDHAGRRHDVPDVARRADHLARHRQRHLAHHLRRHHRRAAGGAGAVLHPGPHRGAEPGGHHRHPGDGGGGGRVRGVHGAGAPQDPHPVPQAPGGDEGLWRRARTCR